MAFFVGGQLVVVAAVMPVERRFADRTRLRAIARRFGIGVTGRTRRPRRHRIGVSRGFLERRHSAVILLASLAIVWLGLNIAH